MRLSARIRPSWIRRWQPAGWLALLGMLALSSPGVVATVRAEPPVAEAPASAVPAGPSCDAGAAAPPLQLQQVVEAARQRAAANPEVVVLNNRGYRYGNAESGNAEVQALIQQLRAQQARQAR